MGQSPRALLFYGMYLDQVPARIKDLERDGEEILSHLLGITDLSYQERIQRIKTFEPLAIDFLGYDRDKVAVSAFRFGSRDWGTYKIKDLPEDPASRDERLRAFAYQLGVENADAHHIGWYLDADFR